MDTASLVAVIVSVMASGLSLVSYFNGRAQRRSTLQNTDADTFSKLSETVRGLSDQIDEYRQEIDTLRQTYAHDTAALREDVRRHAAEIESIRIELTRSDEALNYLTLNIRDSHPDLVKRAVKIRRGERAENPAA